MLSMDQEKYTQFELAQLRNFQSIDEHQNADRFKATIDHIIKEGFDINYIFTINVSEKTTALHWAYQEQRSVELFTILLNHKADFTIKNGEGQTVLHLITQNFLEYESHCTSDLQFVNAVLSAHVKFQKYVNPTFNGISHLHAACIVNHTRAIELFLKNGTSVNEAVDIKSSQCAGYTPLHFAAKFSTFEATQLLLNNGANLFITCAKGLTPIQLLMQQRLELFGMQHGISSLVYPQKYVEKSIDENEKILKLLLKNDWSSISGLTKFHIACMLKDSSIAKLLFENTTDVNYSVSDQLSVFQKFTALDLAAFCNIDTFKFLISRGISTNIKDKSRNIVFNSYIRKYEVLNIHRLLLCHPIWKNIAFSNGKTILPDVVLSMKSARGFSSFLKKNSEDINMFIPTNSILWPGYTLLHLAVTLLCHDTYIFDDRIAMVQNLLEYPVNINSQDIHGQTAIHLAFQQKEMIIIELLIQHLILNDDIINLADEYNLSYLHIACAMREEKLVSKLLETSNPNINYNDKFSFYSTITCSIHRGWTPLHIAVSLKNVEIVRLLVNGGANVNSADMEGLTPIHWLLSFNDFQDNDEHTKISDILFTLSNLTNCTVPQFGLNYLHVASHVNNVRAVEKLIALKVSPHTMICYEKDMDRFPKYDQERPSTFLANYVDLKPLHFAIASRNSTKIINLLLRYADDTFPTKIEQTFILKEKNKLKNFMLILKNNSVIQKNVEKRLGFSMLHVAVYLTQVKLVKRLLNQGADVNAQIFPDSLIFPGFTPLHICSDRYNHLSYDDISKLVLIIELLLNHKADVTLLNTQKDTPIFTLYNADKYSLYYMKKEILAKLLSHQCDFKINPCHTNISHFHVACRINDYQVIKKFLQCGRVDINQPITSLTLHSLTTYTPLHLALDFESRSTFQVIDLLLDHGSDVQAKDIDGNTPLHKAVHIRSSRLKIVEKLLAHGACINTENIAGVTPFEEFLKSGLSIEEIQLFINRGCRVNGFNRFSGEGYFGKFLTIIDEKWEENLILKELIKFLDAATVDDAGRTIIHNTVTVSIPPNPSFSVSHYYELLDDLLSTNKDIDNQDNLGKTALHYAAQFGNEMGMAALLKLGADINIVDKSGKLALSYSVDRCADQSHFCNRRGCYSCMNINMLLKHMNKLQYLGLEVNRFHREIDNDFLKNHSLKGYTLKQQFYSTVEKTKDIIIASGLLNLHSFLFETGAVSLYPYLDRRDCNDIECFFNSISQMHLEEIEDILKLQYNKAVLRCRLIDQAIDSLRECLGFSFPGLCEEIIRYLPNYDLKVLITSTSEIQ